jgi:hypothetical protein
MIPMTPLIHSSVRDAGTRAGSSTISARSVAGRSSPLRDYTDWQMYPRDSELQGILYYNWFWARVWLGLWLVLMILGFVVHISFTVAGIFG